MSAEKSRNLRETGLRNEIIVFKRYFVQRFLDGLQMSLAFSALTRHLRSDFSALPFDSRSPFQPFFAFEKLSLESDSSPLFSFSNISTTFQRLNTVHF